MININKNLTERQISELQVYIKLIINCIGVISRCTKNIKDMTYVALKLSSVVLTTTGAAVGSVTLNPIFLASVAGSGVLLQTIITKKNFIAKS